MNLVAKLFPRRFVQASLHSVLSEVFAIEPGPLQLAAEEAAQRVRSMTPTEIKALAMTDRSSSPARMTVVDGVAHIPVDGCIIPGDASCARWMGMAATGIAEIQHALDVALESADVKSIVLDIDSPGGSVGGLHALGEEIFAAREKKPITAHVTGQCCSAAYWIGCNASEITAEPTATIGSIGVYSMIFDTSKLFEQMGVKAHLLRSGEHKGVGEDGIPITDKQLAALQERIDDLAAIFTETVARGRGLELAKAKELATGKAWIAAKAEALELIDGIENSRGAHTRAKGGAPGAAAQNDSGDAAETTTAPVSAEEMMTTKENTPATPAVAAAPTVEARDAENAALKEQLAQMKAERAIMEQALNATKTTQVKAIVDRHAAAGRVTPQMRAEIDAVAMSAYANAPEKLDAFLATLPVQTQSKAQGDTPAQRDESQMLSAIDEQIAHAAGIEVAEAHRRGEVASIGADGKYYDENGKVLVRKETK